jgi:TRAP-type C4-dicarboxylate transport system permease small subunit
VPVVTQGEEAGPCERSTACTKPPARRGVHDRHAGVRAGIFGRLFGFHIRGTDAYAGYCMAVRLWPSYTLRRNEHIRVTLLLSHVPPAARKALEVWCHVLALALSGILAYYCVRLAWQSRTFNDISTGNDATPLWIPQLAMALGTVILFVAFVDAFIAVLRDGQNRKR